MSEASSDTGTVLAADAWGGHGRLLTVWNMYMPKHDAEAALPIEAVALLGAISRLQSDPDFVAECASWFDEDKN